MLSEAYKRISFFYRHWFKAQWTETPPDDVMDLFKDFSVNNEMSRTKLREFLITYQEMAKDNAEVSAQSIIASRNLKGFGNICRKYLSSNGFFQYLLSHKNLPLYEKGFDGEALLVNYFVYASHHSCLKQKPQQSNLEQTAKRFLKFAKDKTSSEAEKKITYNSIKAIEKALEDGVRVIELDLCPSSDKSDIDVSHPRAERQSHSIMTLKKCLEAISEKAFVTSDFPLMMILVKHFDPQLSDYLQTKLDKRIKTFVKNKKLCPLTEALQSPLDSLRKSFIILTKRVSLSPNTDDNAHDTISDYNENLDVKIRKMTENQLEDATGDEYIRITQKDLLAVYPNSNPEDPVFTKNFDPLIGWTHGAQIVTSNIQDLGRHLWVMQGLFRAQGGTKPTGYVKKPGILLDPPIFDPTKWRPVKKILKVKVYLGTGWHLDFDREEFDDTSPPDFFTAVEIAGVPADEAREKTVPAMDQWVPQWDQEFTFPLTVPELAMLMIEVKEFDPDRSHDFGGQTCLPVCQLRSGIRSVPLYDRFGKPLRSARLLMRFKFD